MKNILIKLIPVVAVLFANLFLSCDNTDEFTGDSSLEVNLPTVSINYPYDAANDITEADAKYPFTISIDKAVDWDVVLKVSVKEGATATSGTDFLAPEYINIKAGSTTGTANIEIFADEDFEETESFTLVIGDPVINSIATSKEVTWNIANLASGDLAMHLSWDMSEKTTDSSGDDIDPTDFADLIFRLSSTPDDSGDIDEADGGSFEDLLMESTLPDGTYYISASFNSANEDIIRDLDLTVDFSQVGVAASSSSFPAALNNLGTCELNYFVLGKITKAGSNYTFEELGEKSYDVLPYVSWPNGEDVTDFYGTYPSNITVKEICDGFYIKGLNAAWMLDIWGEEIQPETEADVFAILSSDGTFVIEEQFIFTTIYKDDPFDYTVYGSGTYDPIAGELHIEYYLDTGGFNVSEYWESVGGMTTKYFEANVTL